MSKFIEKDPNARKLRHPTEDEALAYWRKWISVIGWDPAITPLEDLWLYSDGTIRLELTEESKRKIRAMKGDPGGESFF